MLDVTKRGPAAPLTQGGRTRTRDNEPPAVVECGGGRFAEVTVAKSKKRKALVWRQGQRIERVLDGVLGRARRRDDRRAKTRGGPVGCS